jgi:hypothetical protein
MSSFLHSLRLEDFVRAGKAKGCGFILLGDKGTGRPDQYMIRPDKMTNLIVATVKSSVIQAAGCHATVAATKNRVNRSSHCAIAASPGHNAARR